MECNESATYKYVWPGCQVFNACNNHLVRVKSFAESLSFDLAYERLPIDGHYFCSGKMFLEAKENETKNRIS